MTVVVCTAHDAPYKTLAAITFPSVRRYCEKHDYAGYYDPDIDPTEADACKARIFLDLYASGRFGADDIFMWIDTDALIMNSDVKVEDLAHRYGLTADGGKHFLWGYDFNGPNSGVWFARFTSHAAHYVQVYHLAARAMGWGDNTAMDQKMLLPPFRDWVACVPGKAFNAYPYALHGKENWAHRNEVNNYEDGDFILHAAGIEPATRMSVLREFARSAR